MPWAPERQNLDGCWLWAAGKTSDGYGWYSAAHVYVHRAAYEAFVGPIPLGYQVDHLCRVRHCYNPEHLEAVTQAENVRRQPNVIAQMARTHCSNGHVIDGRRRKGTGWVRRCLTCHRDRERARRREKVPT